MSSNQISKGLDILQKFITNSSSYLKNTNNKIKLINELIDINKYLYFNIPPEKKLKLKLYKEYNKFKLEDLYSTLYNITANSHIDYNQYLYYEIILLIILLFNLNVINKDDRQTYLRNIRPHFNKTKTIPTQIISSTTREPIVLMFLGDIMDSNDHTNTFFESADDTLYIIIHPKDKQKTLDKINSNTIYKQMLDKGHIILTPENESIETAWATFSLVAAQLLMIQYMLITYGHIFKKFILVSPTDAPLYNYQIMYKELVSDNKSWIYYSNEGNGYSRDMFKKIYTYEGGIFNLNDAVYISQWCAIDKTHIPFYFDMTLIKKKKPTYIKKLELQSNKPVEICDGPTNYIVSVSNDPKFQQYIDSHVGSWKVSNKTHLHSIINTDHGYCATVDESYFGTVLKHNIKQHKLKDHIRYQYIKDLRDRISLQFINPIKNEHNSRYIFNNNGKHATHTRNCRIWHGTSPGFNLNNLEYQIRFIPNQDISANDDEKYFIVKNNKIFPISDEKRQSMINDFDNNNYSQYETLIGGELKNASGTILKLGKKNIRHNNSESYSDIYTISTTYADWSLVNPSPSNMFRDFRFNQFFSNTNIKNFLGIEVFKPGSIQSLIKSIEPNVLLDELRNFTFTTDKINDTFIKGPMHHPVEYEEYTLQQVLNSYNLIKYLDIPNNSKSIFKFSFDSALDIYQDIINNNIISLDKTSDNYYVFKSSVTDNIKNKKYGYTINAHILNNALLYGSLFIRKVSDVHALNLYSDQLFNLPDYVPNIKDSKTQRTCKNARNYRFVKKLNIVRNKKSVQTSCKFTNINDILCKSSSSLKDIRDIDVLPTQNSINDKTAINNILNTLVTNKINCLYRQNINPQLNCQLMVYFSSYNEKLDSLKRCLYYEGHFLLFCDYTNKWYTYINEIDEYVKKIIRSYSITTTIIIGQSMGGYGALYLSTCIDNAICFAFCPQVFKTNKNLFNYHKINIDNDIPNIKNLITESTTNSIRYVFTGRNQRDIFYANYLNYTSKNTYVYYIDFKPPEKYLNISDDNLYDNETSKTLYNNEHRTFQHLQYTVLFDKFKNNKEYNFNNINNNNHTNIIEEAIQFYDPYKNDRTQPPLTFKPNKFDLKTLNINTILNNNNNIISQNNGNIIIDILKIILIPLQITITDYDNNIDKISTLIWKALQLSGYSNLDKWINLNYLNKILDDNLINIHAETLSNIKHWSTYALYVLIYYNDISKIETTFSKFKELLINNNNAFLKKYLKYKQKYLQYRKI